MEELFPYIKVNFIVFWVGAIVVPIVLATIKLKHFKLYSYEWLVLLLPIVIYRLVWLSYSQPKSDGNLAMEPIFIGMLVSCTYIARYYFRKLSAKSAPICFAVSCVIPVVIYLCITQMPA